MAEITSYEVEVTGMGGDASTQYQVTCPDCGEHVLCADFGWWSTKCSCGYSWSVTVKATGSKWDDEDE